VALAFAVAASANLPTLLYSLFWKRFNTTGALYSIYGGLAASVLLIIFSPAVSGSGHLDDQERQLPLVPAVQPRPGVHPAVFLWAWWAPWWVAGRPAPSRATPRWRSGR